MKKKSFTQKVLLLWLLVMLGSLSVWAQDRTVSGTVTSFTGNETLPGVAVRIKGTTSGTITDLDGKYQIQVPSAEAVIEFSFVGYNTEEQQVGNRSVINVQLTEDIETLGEVVVVGYGTQKKSDVTGSVTAISTKDFNKGLVTTPDQLITGKVAGVQITPNNGAPGSGSQIRIRGGASLNASNDPLIVIDGVPIDNSSIAGAPNPLSMINPNDIETYTILKDASATAIYGSRASNGVIIIQTKSGSADQKFTIGFNTQHSVSTLPKQVDVLTGDEFRTLVNERGRQSQIGLLGEASNNWQDAIFQNAYSTDNNLTFTGGVKNLPYRISLNYLNQEGILKTGKLDRKSVAVNLSPSFLNNHLKAEVNVKGAWTDNRFANQGAIGSAIRFDPTQPIYQDNEYRGYYEWIDEAGNLIQLASRNPLGMIEQQNDVSDVRRILGNLKLEYKFHFLPELKAVANVGIDRSESEGSNTNFAVIQNRYSTQIRPYSQTKKNDLLDLYLNYAKEIESIASRVDLTAGYSYQDFETENPAYGTRFPERADSVGTLPLPSFYPSRLISFFGRANYTFQDRYVLTATLRRDGSSNFGSVNQYGLFPSVAFAWRIAEEGFLRESKTVSDLKLRLGYGVTGQQDIGQFLYLPRYTPSSGTAQYQFGDTFYNVYRAQYFDEGIQWEETATINAGIDFGFWKNRLTGTLDYYKRKTDRLLVNEVAVPAGANLRNRIATNIGNLENEGVEASLNFFVLNSGKLSWEIGLNGTYNQNTITNLTMFDTEENTDIEVGGISGGTGNNVQIHRVGLPRNTFSLYQQIYDQNGIPIEGLYVDQDKDGEITEADRVANFSPDPKYLMGFSTRLGYDKLSLSFVLRGAFNNYVYNNINSDVANYRSFASNTEFLQNVPRNVLTTEFAGQELFSDYYLENASFVRMDNINLSYSIGRVLQNKLDLGVSASVQNVFTITKYSGLDPEIADGIDNNFYPRPRVFTLGLNANF